MIEENYSGIEKLRPLLIGTTKRRKVKCSTGKQFAEEDGIEVAIRLSGK